MENELIQFDKNLSFYFKTQKETRDIIKKLDDLYKKIHNINENNDIPNDYEYIKQRTPLDIILKCYAIKSDLTISHKHMLLSTQDQEHIYFAKLICMTIHTGLEFIENIMHYLKLNSNTKDIELLISIIRKVHKYKKLIESTRDHSIAHIDPNFSTYYDSMLNIFKMPLKNVVEDFIEAIQYIEKLGHKINKKQLEGLRKHLKEITNLNIEKIKNDSALSNKKDILRACEECYNFFNLKDVQLNTNE